jgi:hypothetical protein
MTTKLMLKAALSTLLLCIATGDSAFADSLWDHNGSVMRLVADGDQRQLLYERPRQILRGAGVQQGTVLFDGYRVGNKYKGTAKRFSKNCSAPLPYEVSGTVVTETKVVLKGRREVYDDNCRPTGRFKTDTLVFKYLSASQETTTVPQTKKLTVEGRWSANAEGCSVERNYNGEYINVDAKGVFFDVESGCFFEGGRRVSPSHWEMIARCESAGQYEGGGAPPRSKVELLVQGGTLHITIKGDESFKGHSSYAVKCR